MARAFLSYQTMQLAKSNLIQSEVNAFIQNKKINSNVYHSKAT